MASWIKRKTSSLAFFIQKAYWKIVTAKPSIFLIAALTVAASIFLLGGGIYDLLEKPLLAVIASGGRIIVYYPYALNDQFLVESIIIMIVYAIGAVGLILTYQSTKYVYRPRQAFILLLVGCILIIVSYIFVEQSLLIRWG